MAKRILAAGRRGSAVALLALCGLLGAGIACRDSEVPAETGEAMSTDHVAEEFVRLALALGRHDPDYVDAYLGPESWRAEAAALDLDAAAVRERALELVARLDGLGDEGATGERERRRRALERTIESLAARAGLVGGGSLTFDEESRALYDAVAPAKSPAELEAVIADLDRRLPAAGDGATLGERLEGFRANFHIPADKLDAVFQSAIEACRERTVPHIELPAGESFVVEYVTGKSWSGYNWYQGGYRSLIQVNTDLPITIDRAIDLACHEGYPGHHVYNILVERELVEGRGWSEYLLYPLFSPRSLIAEGTANFGVEVAFPGDERLDFERRVLFPLAGLDPGRAAEYAAVERLRERLSYAGNEAARRYLDGDIDAAAARDWLERYALMSPARAEQRLRFIEQYRSYVINYNLGEDMVRAWIERQGGTRGRTTERWRLFAELLSTPFLPSDLE